MPSFVIPRFPQFVLFDWFLSGSFSKFGHEQFEFWKSSTDWEFIEGFRVKPVRQDSVSPFHGPVLLSVQISALQETAPPRVDPFSRIFPKMSMCMYYYHGLNGAIDEEEVTCVLSLNILNEKIFLALWIWLYFLIAVSALALALRVLTFLCRPVRRWTLAGRLGFASYADVRVVCDAADVSEWFILTQLSRNVNAHVMDSFFVFLAEQYRGEAKERKRGKLQGVHKKEVQVKVS